VASVEKIRGVAAVVPTHGVTTAFTVVAVRPLLQRTGRHDGLERNLLSPPTPQVRLNLDLIFGFCRLHRDFCRFSSLLRFALSYASALRKGTILGSGVGTVEEELRFRFLVRASLRVGLGLFEEDHAVRRDRGAGKNRLGTLRDPAVQSKAHQLLIAPNVSEPPNT
jgi:hypothetical protein